MELSLVTVAFDPERRAFPRAPLAAIEGEILNVVEHFFHFDGVRSTGGMLARATFAVYGADASGSRIRRLSPGVDQTAVPCLVAGTTGSSRAPRHGNEASTTGRGTSVWRPVLSRGSSA